MPISSGLKAFDSLGDRRIIIAAIACISISGLGLAMTVLFSE